MKVCTICGARFRGNPSACPLDGGSLEELPDELLGRTIGGRYHISEKIGAGGMGTVYRAKHEVVGRDVAVKFLSPELATDSTNRKRFLREAKAANRINHEHIIDITDFGQTDDGLVFLVMEYLDGVPLSEEIARSPMDTRRSLAIALQVAQALARAHELDVVHRDIKPENIYLLHGYEGDFVKILDFGLAQMKGELRLTATGTVFGTPEYMSPEQARGAPCTFSADLYALGCVIFEMMTGDIPFTGSTPDLIVKHMREPPPAPSSQARAVPAEVDQMVLKLLEKRPEDRHRSAYQLAEEIKNLLESLGGRNEPHRIQRSGSYSMPPGGELTHTAVTEDAWDERLSVFRSLVGVAHGSGGAPSWLEPAIDDLSNRLGRLRRKRIDLEKMASAASQQESTMRQARLRIGRALDELGQDESRLLQQIAEAEPRLIEAQQRLSELEKPLLRAWGEIPPLSVTTPTLSREVVDSLRNAGQLAAIWIEAERSVAALERDVNDRHREHEDLRFQIAQLKGRLGTINAEAEVDLGSLRSRISRLDSELRGAIDSIVKNAEPVYRHFMSFPHLREAVLSGGTPSNAPRP